MTWSFNINNSKVSSIFSKNTNVFHMGNSYRLIIDGYIAPRYKYFDEYKNYDMCELITKLFDKFEFNFIDYIKGVFNILIFSDDELHIFNDRKNIKKYFIREQDGQLIISNDLSQISKDQKISMDKENIAIFTLLSHFIGDTTMFKGIKSSLPAQYISFNDGGFEKKRYWSPVDIINNKVIDNKKNINDHAYVWQNIICNNIDYLKPCTISLTLTGGNDSRMLFAVLRSLKLKFKTFTYGNPLSQDVLIAKQLSEHCGLEHNCYFVEKPTIEWFSNISDEILQIGNSMINIHRAHRLDAIKKEVAYSKPDMFITGLVGGEYIKEPILGGTIIPELFERLINEENIAKKKDIIQHELIKTCIDLNEIDLEKVYLEIDKFLELTKGFSSKEQKFILVYLYYGCIHHSQDSSLYVNNVKYLYNPFMDIDSLELLASYKKWYLNKKTSFIDRLFHSEYIVKITDILDTKISNIPYYKKGQYTANEILNNKSIYLLKRSIRFFLHGKGKEDVSNFPIGKWMHQYCEKKIHNANDEEFSIFNMSHLNCELQTIRNEKLESKWHIITNPVNVIENIKQITNMR